ncbi:MAG: TonB-dependent receptor domain-containing protein [Lysobacteraceae bacterium]
MKREQSRRIGRLSPLAVAVGFAIFASGQAMATVQEPEAEETTGADTAAQLEQIRVTGSRIPRAGFDTLEPASSINREYVEIRGLTNIADALNELPSFGVGVTPQGAQSSFGVGLNFVNNFGLGSNRTLTVVNGRRFVSSSTASIFGPGAPGLQVDLNQIPTQLIDRVDSLNIGGAPTYGSDAIAGTVNIILRQDFEGLEVGATYGLTEQGDNQRYGASVIWGANFLDNRANLTLALAYDQSEGVLQSERDLFRRGLFFSANPNAGVMEATQPGRDPRFDGRFDPTIPFKTAPGDGIPTNVLIRDRRIYSTPPGGLLMPSGFPFGAGPALQGFGPDGQTFLAFDGSGNIVPYDPGSSFSFVDASGGDGLALWEQGQIISDVERMTFFTNARFDITDRTHAFFEGMYYEAETLELTSQSIYNSPLFGGLSAPIIVQATHPLLSSQAQGVLADNGIDSFFLSRASRDLVENNAGSDIETRRGVFGLAGDFDLGNRLFYWEVSANRGRNEQNFFQTVLNQQHFINAINVSVDGSGQVVCDPTAGSAGYAAAALNNPVADPNCVPLDLFGEGRPSAAARAYVTDQTNAVSVIDQTVYNANVSSTLFDLWSGPVQYNIGLERRIERARFTPDEFQQQGLGRAVAITPTDGEFRTRELFGELIVPLVDPNADITLLRRLDVTGKFRRVDNTINDASNTYTYGLQYRPFDDLEFRGNFTRSIRSPAVTELFTPTASIFTFVNDPCDSRFLDSGDRPATRRANCQVMFNQLGIDGDSFISNARSATIQGTTGGNDNLLNERADSITYGLIWQPSFVPGFEASMDYYQIEIEDVITNLNATAIAEGCFDNFDFDGSDFRTANSFCERLVRDANGQLIDVTTGYVNGAFLNFRGLETKLVYTIPTDRFGTFNITATQFRLKKLENSANAITITDQKGQIGNAEIRNQFNLAWQGARLGANLSANYIGASRFNNQFNEESQDILRVNGKMLVNVGGSMRIGNDGIVRLAVTNLFDDEPPFPTAGIGTYDILGRRYTVSANWKF